MMPECRGSFFPYFVRCWVFACSLCCLLLSVVPFESNQAWGAVLLDEHFASLARWHVQLFGDKPPSSYSATLREGQSCLLMESNNSASLLVLNKEFNVYEYPKLSWRWKVNNVYRNGDSSKTDGDDYPARLYIMFPYDPDRISFVESFKYQVALTIYGPPVPGSSINYIWDNRVTMLGEKYYKPVPRTTVKYIAGRVIPDSNPLTTLKRSGGSLRVGCPSLPLARQLYCRGEYWITSSGPFQLASWMLGPSKRACPNSILTALLFNTIIAQWLSGLRTT